MTNVHPLPQPKPKRAHRARTGMGVFVTDAELAEWLGVPYETARPVFAELDRDKRKGFPQKQPIWGGRRYLPAVEQWLTRNYGFNMASPIRRSADEYPPRD